MNWWYLAVAGYLVVCWVGYFRIMKLDCPDEENRRADAAIARAASEAPLLLGACELLAILFVGPFMPLIVAFCAWTGWRDRRAWRKFARTFRETMFEYVHVANMPAAAQQHIDHHAPMFEELEFGAQGTYLLRPEPLPIYSKLFLSVAGETVVDVSLIGKDAGYSFTSVLENGHVIETACTASAFDTDRINASGRFTAVMVERDAEGDTLSSQYARHRESLVQLEQRFGCGTLHFESDQVKPVMSYANRLFAEVMMELGELDEGPPAAVCPKGRMNRIEQIEGNKKAAPMQICFD